MSSIDWKSPKNLALKNDNTTNRIAELTTRVAEQDAEIARLRHIAADMIQHVDWLTSGLPNLLDRGGLVDEEGLIGAAIDAANSARAALTPAPALDDRPDIAGDPICKIASYNDCHQIAVELGYPSLIEALEDLEDLKQLNLSGWHNIIDAYLASQNTCAKFRVGDHVTKTKGSSWTGRVVGTYSTELTPEGYAVESDTEVGSVQIYPATALELKELCA